MFAFVSDALSQFLWMEEVAKQVPVVEWPEVRLCVRDGAGAFRALLNHQRLLAPLLRKRP